MTTCDVLIIGSGIAGLSLAIKLSKEFPDKKIFIVTKDDELQSNTRHAQGGISVVSDFLNDSFDKHISDTIRAGDELCDPEVVRRVVHAAPEALRELIQNGVDFDRDAAGNFILANEGGHSHSRVAHHKDLTGFQIVIALLLKVKTLPGITLLPHHAVIDLITVTGNKELRSCCGAFILNRTNKTVGKIISSVTVLATGGLGQVYAVNTNPEIATGDGIAMAYRAGADVINMEFIQFHPTALFLKQHGRPCFLITEALRGYGGFLKNGRGERFMFRYDSRGELASRDIVSRAIQKEMFSDGVSNMFMDCTHLPSEKLISDFPMIHTRCLENGIDVTKELIPVVPAAHYVCGGVKVNLSGETSVVNLYALGECSNTGLHGANRLASNSLLEAVTFAEFSFQHIREKLGAPVVVANYVEDSTYIVAETSLAGVDEIRRDIQQLMSTHAGIIRSTMKLREALTYIRYTKELIGEYFPAVIDFSLMELQNIVTCAELIIVQSLARMSNCGTFYNCDLDEEALIDMDKQRMFS